MTQGINVSHHFGYSDDETHKYTLRMPNFDANSNFGASETASQNEAEPPGTGKTSSFDAGARPALSYPGRAEKSVHEMSCALGGDQL